MARRKDPRNTEWSLKAASVPKAAQYWCSHRNSDLSDTRATSVNRLGNCSRQLTFDGTDINSSSGDWECQFRMWANCAQEQSFDKSFARKWIIDFILTRFQHIWICLPSFLPPCYFLTDYTQVMSRGTLAWLKASPAVPWEIVSTVQYCSCTKR